MNENNMSGHENNNPRAGVSSHTQFVRGRGRGTWNKRRPYFFRTGGSSKKRSKTNIPSVFPQVPGEESLNSLQNRELFTAPTYNDDYQLQVISILNPLPYPGWRLYFPTEMFLESSMLASQIKAFETHIQKYPGSYILSEIRQQQWFNVSADLLLKDDEFCSSWSNITKELQDSPYIVLSCLGVAMHRVVISWATETSLESDTTSSFTEYKRKKVVIPKICARPIGFFDVSSICDITPESFDKMIAVHGRVSCIVSEETKCNWVAYKCKRCGHEQAIRQMDFYPTKPLRCQLQCNSRRNFVELRSSPYTKIQCVQMIQLNEVGLKHLNNSLYIYIELQEDLVDQIYPGLEITVTGVLKLKCLTKNLEHQKGIKQNYYLDAVSLIKQTESGNVRSVPPTQKDVEVVQMITREQNCFRLLVQSLVPEMCGYEMMKMAVLLSLFGGSDSPDGEINVLLVGDPGLGKSNLLKNISTISQRGKLVSVKDPSNFIPTYQNASNLIDTGSVLISQSGHCCIDDIEKLSQNQETLIHIMQTKSIAARSQYFAFNIGAKSAIVAAANPAGGHYDASKLLRENVRLNPSFLSLFHLIFVIYDKADKDRDNTLTEHVKALHSGMKKILSIPPKFSMEMKPNDYMPQSEEIDLDEQLKVNPDEQLDLLPAILLKKYIDYARLNIRPLLTDEAVNEIKEYYMALRTEKNEEERFSITTKQLEGLILLTQARARTELSFEATKKHACDVIALVRHSYTNTAVVDRVNTTLNGSIAGTSHGSQVKKFIQMLQVRSNSLGRKIFEFEELKDMATHAGIRCGVANLVDLVNMQGYLLKKGPNLYEVRTQ